MNGDSATSWLVREATKHDVDQIVSLWSGMMAVHGEMDARFRFAPGVQKDVHKHIRSTLRSRAARIYIAQHETQIIGYILGELHTRRPIYPIGQYGFISDLMVAEKWRGSGIGSALAKRVEEWFRAEGVTTIELFVAEANEGSTSFWENVGFRSYLRLVRKEL
jgi:GNAT superfamily N-acetyltransferase